MCPRRLLLRRPLEHLPANLPASKPEPFRLEHVLHLTPEVAGCYHGALMADTGDKPTHPLADVKRAVEARRVFISEDVKNDANDVVCSTADIHACLLGLRDSEFYKTMPSKKRPGCMQDVYRTHHPEIRSMPIYLKFDLAKTGYVVVLSFKYDTGGQP